ncbi:CHASE2 domain-containing protein [Massilia sp. GCM10020059]|uniref:Adenylate/guanylate cyclase domain-containing protein n=1 Tax=Massilia agrisoli TaxID=2892444 RepID=A0ABS8J0A2_9BURK|nr:adenylate/guanylate cyclase domain-containing protein [Massilia agrisoli]MCC6073467.1 adenylate/guanylate cyclase domain-containing protein [Massilia agrisoli]
MFHLPPELIRAAIAAAAILLTVWSQWGPAPAVSFFGNEWLRDVFLKVQKSDAPEPRILVVDIDETSTARLGPWPWPRERIAELVETLLTEYGARGVALDILMPEAADANGDTRLALLAQHGPVVLAQAFDFQPNRPEPLRLGVLAGATAGAAAQAAVPATGYIANHAGLARAPKVGNIGFIPDPDGVLRRVPLQTRFEGRVYPALSLALLNCCSGGAPLALPSTDMMRVSFTRDWPAYTVVTAAEILRQEVDPGSLSGRLVLIGSSSLGQGDRVATPLGSIRPGLGVQAAMLTTLLDLQQGVAPAPWPGAVLALLFSLASALLATYAFPRLSAVFSVGLLGAMSACWLAVAYFASRHDPDFSTTGPLASNLFLLAFAVPYQWQLTQRRSRHLLDTLRQYVAPAVVQELLRSDLDDPLQPRQLDVTTLIADMEGYTSHVESLPVEDAARLTRDFLDCLTGPVIEANGTLDKYTGDGLVAFWGAPLPMERHADLALDAAREIVRRVGVLSDARVLAGHAPLRVRIGIESGLAMAGDFGTSFRSIYTAVGDSVNTASRLEQAARDYPHEVIIGPGAVERASRHRFILLGERLLRGKENPTTLFTFDPSMDPVTHAVKMPPTGQPA